MAVDTLPPYKLINNIYYKISLITELEEALQIERFNISKIKPNKAANVSLELIKKINSSYRCKETPNNYNEFIIYYIHRLKHLIGKIKIIDNKQIREGTTRVRVYSINKNNYNKYIKLYNLINETACDKKDIEFLDVETN